MEGVSTDKAPSLGVVLPHFIAGAIFFFVLAIGIFLFSESFIGSYFDSRLFALTHLASLGWGTMIIYGALYQLIPVVFEVSLYSEKLAKFNFWLFLVGVIGMVYSFWFGSLEISLPIYSSITFTSLMLFVYNIYKSIRRATVKNYSSTFITTSFIWLFLTIIAGLLLALNYKFHFLNNFTLELLKSHVHFGVLGWFVQLIFGVASTLVPMFLVSHDMSEKPLKYSHLFLNIGLSILVLNWLLFHYNLATIIGIVFTVTGILFYFYFLYECYRLKLRKLDIGMQMTTVAFASALFPIAFGIYVGFNNANISPNIINLYGFSIFFSFITPLILGQTYKTLPFIIWLDRYQSLVGKEKIPMPGDIFYSIIAKAHLYTFLLSIIILTISIFSNNVLGIKIGSIIFILTAILYNFNVFKMVFHKKIKGDKFAVKLSDRDFMEILKSVIDPEIEINIVDMGLIYNVEFDGDKTVNVIMTLSTPACPIADTIVMNVMQAIKNEYPDFEVDVHITFEPPWNRDMISEEGKRLLEEGGKSI